MAFAISGFHLEEQIYSGPTSVVYRAVRESDRLSVILKLLNKEYPTPEEVSRFRREYELTKKIAGNGAPLVIGLEKYKDTFVILEEDIGGLSLAAFLSLEKPGCADLIILAIRIAECLELWDRFENIPISVEPTKVSNTTPTSSNQVQPQLAPVAAPITAPQPEPAPDPSLTEKSDSPDPRPNNTSPNPENSKPVVAKPVAIATRTQATKRDPKPTSEEPPDNETLSLPPGKGMLLIASSPPCLVYQGDKLLGQTLLEIVLPAGDHTLLLVDKKNKERTKSVKITVLSQQLTKKNITLK